MKQEDLTRASDAAPTATSAPRSGLLTPVLDLFSSVTLGIVLLTLLFFYCTIGSAGILYPVHPNIFSSASWAHEQMRQWRAFEMTEFEWFHWWPFNSLILLISANVIVTTIRRIPFKVVNLGVWTIHTGILILITGSFIYFGTKVEGDAPVARRRLVVEMDVIAADGSTRVERKSLTAAPGKELTLGSGAHALTAQVISIDPAWELRSGADAGVSSYSVMVVLQKGGKKFMRQLIAGHPEYTEDILFTEDAHQPMKRALKETGNAIVDASIRCSLEYEPTSYFYLRNELRKSWSLYVRPKGSPTWTERSLAGMPIYNDYVSDRALVSGGASMPERGLDIVAVSTDPNDPLHDVVLRVKAYLRYAHMRSRFLAGGPNAAPYPIAKIRLASADGQNAEYELEALDPERNKAEGGLLRFVLVSEESQVEALKRAPSLRFRIPAAGIDVRAEIRDVASANPDAAIVDIEQDGKKTGYAYRVMSVQDDLPVGGGKVSLASIELRTPKGTYRRWVFDEAQLTRDVVDPLGSDAHGLPVIADDSIEVLYERGNALAFVTIVAGPDVNSLRVLSTIDGKNSVLPLSLGEKATLPGGVDIGLVEYFPRAVLETKPQVVPREQRQRDAMEQFSLILLEATGGERKWLQFNHWPFDNESQALRRSPYAPETLRLPDGREIEVLFSRTRMPLASRVALEDFELASHDGGFTGETGSIRNYTSILRFEDASTGVWSDPTRVSVNDPVEHEGLWYFQSQWDPPDEARESGLAASKGLNYTVLGIGNRNGVWIQLFGCCVAVSGMLFAFYVKPMIKARRQREVLDGLAQQADGAGSKGERPMRAALTRGWCVLLIAIFTLGFAPKIASAEEYVFWKALDLAPLEQTAVQSEGRVKSLSSMANETLGFISGPRSIGDQPTLYTYFDMLLRPDAYRDADVIYVKGSDTRARISQALLAPSEGKDPLLLARMQAFQLSGLISEELLAREELRPVLRALEGDLIRTAKVADMVKTALRVKDPRFLLDRLKIVPRGDGDQTKSWHTIGDVMFVDGTQSMPGPLTLLAEKSEAPTDLSPETSKAISDAWRSFASAWLRADPQGVNAAAAALATSLEQVDAAHYPDKSRLQWENWYFKNGQMTRTWLVYMASVIFLLLGIVWKWPKARIIGCSIFALGLILQTIALLLRWYIADRWPNSNMFEAVTTASWMGAMAAVIIEVLVRKSALRGMFILGAACASMVALMAAYFLPVQLNPNISNMMPVLHDVWLYIHTNVIIFSYCLIFMASVSAVLYLVHRAIGGAATFARVGGAGSMIILGAHGEERMSPKRAALGEVLDGTTMLLMELSFVFLWTGLVMGAIWADHSWGRPWGWDPKEVFALNTFLVFAVLVHVRVKVKDKGLWTAWLALIGAGVMLFNWIVINFIITGLHSYA
ncbi:MAG: hypothetical protein EXS10_03490 [Phycisphaerales bacterium]|nr:hypothetical protein [Phycisphaerales bacterium]